MKSKTDNLGAGILIGIVVAVIFIALLLMGCTTTRVVEVPVTHQEHHWHTDSVHEVDSVIKEKMTTVMMLDSAAMAQYGIQLTDVYMGIAVSKRHVAVDLRNDSLRGAHGLEGVA